MYRARFSNADSSFGGMRLLQNTWNPEWRHPASIDIISREIFPLAISMAKNLMPEYGLQFFHLQRGAGLRPKSYS